MQKVQRWNLPAFLEIAKKKNPKNLDKLKICFYKKNKNMKAKEKKFYY